MTIYNLHDADIRKTTQPHPGGIHLDYRDSIPQQEYLLITKEEFWKLANVHTDGISPAEIVHISFAVNTRSRPLDAELKKERERVLDEFVAAIEFRFDDTNRGRGVVGTIRGIRESLRGEP